MKTEKCVVTYAKSPRTVKHGRRNVIRTKSDMMKPTLVPVYFQSGLNPDFERQLNILKDEEAEIGALVPLGAHLLEADAVLFR